MGFFDWLVARDRRLAATKYAGRESASDQAARVRREKHRSKGVKRATSQGERWEQRDRRRFT